MRDYWVVTRKEQHINLSADEIKVLGTGTVILKNSKGPSTSVFHKPIQVLDIGEH